MMDIFQSTRSYEAWLPGISQPTIAAHLRLKHERMREAAFPFLRATFYRWAQNWAAEVAPEFERDPVVLSVGDLHIENFGTWRDVDGRLIWGVNDFDEAYPLPAAHDLVRLIVSARLAVRTGAFGINEVDVSEAVLDGYARGARDDGHPFVLEERNRWLRKIAMNELRDPATFWDKLNKLKDTRVSTATKRVLVNAMPTANLECRYVERIAGLGSLGRPRVLALAEWGGGFVCREAKAAAPSACAWAFGVKSTKSRSAEAIARARRVRDPFYSVVDGWVVRRLAPHCSKIDVASLPRKRDELELLTAMGTETANVHLGGARSGDLRKVVNDRGRKSIVRAADRMADLTLADWKAWKRG